MTAVITSLSKAFGQLTDPAILKVMGKSMAITLATFIALGVALWRGAANALESWLAGYGEGLGAVAALLITILAGWLLFRIVALAVMQFFADEVVAAVEARHYPHAAATARKLPFHQDAANSLRGVGRALLFNLLAAPIALVLLFTAIGPAVIFWLVNSVLLGRELTDMGWLRHCHAPSDPSPVGRAERLALGGAITAMMALPLLNLLAPVIGAAAGTHLVQMRRGTDLG